ncbi:hypothetical protein WDU94_015644 [Cyamophila willieti]
MINPTTGSPQYNVAPPPLQYGNYMFANTGGPPGLFSPTATPMLSPHATMTSVPAQPMVSTTLGLKLSQTETMLLVKETMNTIILLIEHNTMANITMKKKEK